MIRQVKWSKKIGSRQTKSDDVDVVFITRIIFIMDYGKTFFSLVDVVNVYGDKNFLSGVHTQKTNKKNHKKK